MNIVATHPIENHQEKGTCGNPHLSNRPPGYVDAHCVRCHGAMFVPLGATHPCHEKCPPPAPEHQSAEEQRGLAYVERKLGRVSMVEFVQTRRYLHFSSGNGGNGTTTYHEEWGCIINVAYGASYHLGTGPNATAAATECVKHVIAERERLAEEAEHEQADQEIGERFDGLS